MKNELFASRRELIHYEDINETQLYILIFLFVLTRERNNTNISKICKLRKTIFSVFYNISPSNFAILLILGSFF